MWFIITAFNDVSYLQSDILEIVRCLSAFEPMWIWSYDPCDCDFWLSWGWRLEFLIDDFLLSDHLSFLDFNSLIYSVSIKEKLCFWIRRACAFILLKSTRLDNWRAGFYNQMCVPVGLACPWEYATCARRDLMPIDVIIYIFFKKTLKKNFPFTSFSWA